MKKYEVRFDGGESRDTYNGEIIGVDYMLVEVPSLEDEDESIELYAELPADDEKNYDELKEHRRKLHILVRLIKRAATKIAAFLYVKSTFTFPHRRGIIHAWGLQYMQINIKILFFPASAGVSLYLHVHLYK